MGRNVENARKPFLFFFALSIFLLIFPATKVLHSARIILSYLLYPDINLYSKNLWYLRNVPRNVENLLKTEQRNIFLENKIKSNRILIERLQMLEDENRRLTNLLNLRPQLPWKGEWARVLSKNPDNWHSFLFIEKPENSKIKVNFPTVTESRGRVVFVGRVLEVFPSYIKVILVTDRNSSYVCTLGRDGPDALVEGRGKSKIFVKYIPMRLEVKKGVEVFTSPSSMILPSFIYMGKVEKIQPQGEFPNYYMAQVAPGFDVRKVREVFVIYREQTKGVSVEEIK